MKNKLAYFCSSNSWGGLEMNHLRNAQWMLERGHEVLILGLDGSPIHKNALRMDLPFRGILPHRRWYDFKAVRRMIEIVDTENITHFIIRKVGDMSLGAGVKHKLKNHIHVSFFMEMQLGIRKKSIFHTLRYRKIDVWSCPLEWLKKQVESHTHFKNSLVVIPSGIQTSDFNSLPQKLESREFLCIPTNRLIFGMAGRFDPKKGQLLLLEAVSKCTNSDFMVLLMGESTRNEGSEYTQLLNDFIKANNLDDQILLRPHESNINYFYSSIDWMVMASESETVGMVTIESLASGTPILGSNAGGTPEIMNGTEGGILFETMNSDDLAQKIDEIIDKKISRDPARLQALAQQFNHNDVCTKVESALGLTT